MRSSSILVLAPMALLTVLAASGPAALAQDQTDKPPSPAPGLWRMAATVNGEPMASTGMEMCVGDAASMAKLVTPPDKADCVPDPKPHPLIRNPDGSSSLSVDCTLREGGTMTGKMTFSGDFKTRLTMVGEVQKDAPDPIKTTMIMTGTRLGDCRPGQAPGDVKTDPIDLANLRARTISPEMRRAMDAPVDTALELAVDMTGPGGLHRTGNAVDFGRTVSWGQKLPDGRLVAAFGSAGPDVRVRVDGSVQRDLTGLGNQSAVVTSGEVATVTLPGDLVLKVTPTLRPLSAEEAKWQADGGRTFLRSQAEERTFRARQLAEGQIDAEGAAALALGMKVREPVDLAEFQRRRGTDGPAKALMDSARNAHLHKDYAAEAQAYRTAADLGDAEAILLLAGMYTTGRGVAKDPAEGLKLYRQAAETGDPSAQFSVAVAYRERDSIFHDAVEARKWMRLAAEGGEGNAQYALALMYARGEGGPTDNISAYTWFTAASLDGTKRTRKSRDDALKILSPDEADQAKALADQCLASTFKRCEG